MSSIKKTTSESVDLYDIQATDGVIGQSVTSNIAPMPSKIDVQNNSMGDYNSSMMEDEKMIYTDLPRPSDELFLHKVEEISDSTVIKDNLSNCSELEGTVVHEIDVYMPSAMQETICIYPEEIMDAQSPCSSKPELEGTVVHEIDVDMPSAMQETICIYPEEIMDAQSPCSSRPELEGTVVHEIDVDMPSAMQETICIYPEEIMDAQPPCTCSEIFENTNKNLVSLPNIDEKNDSELDQLPISVPKETLISRCDETYLVNSTVEVKTKRRSLWKRTKRMVQRLVCCGRSPSKVERSSSGMLAGQMESVVNNVDIGLPSVITREPELTDLICPADEVTVQTAHLQIEKISDPAEVALIDYELESVHVSSPLESMILECDEIVPVANTKHRSLWKKLFC